MTGSEFGDLVLVPFPFTDQSTTKRRPAVVVSSAAYHRERQDLIILAVTSQSRPAAGVGEPRVFGAPLERRRQPLHRRALHGAAAADADNGW